MANFNKVILAGNLTRDPELRYTPKGMAIAKITLAINRRWRDPATNEDREEVTFVDVDAFGKQAEVIAQYMKKGRPFLVEGRLKYDTWDDKQSGQKRSKLHVVLEAFSFIDSRVEGGDSGGGAPPDASRNKPAAAPAPAAPASAAAPEPAPTAAEPPSEDDVPF